MTRNEAIEILNRLDLRIDAIITADSLVPPELCCCDEDYCCSAHETTSRIVESRFNTGRSAVWLIDVQRAARLMGIWRRA